MTPTNGSDDLALRLLAVFLALVIAGFIIPAEMLSSSELLLLWIVMPLVGWLWIQPYTDAPKGN
ncbi:MAG TPA: hypothetical protein VFY83_15560 [Anaerolineales bacterium]|jgi:hypothetical protein|nr:hypothetical protein [Anaerolineales bacterium]